MASVYSYLGGGLAGVLEKNDELNIIKKSDESQAIKICTKNDKFYVNGDKSLFDVKKMNEFVKRLNESEDIVPREEIIRKCDEWLKMFKDLYPIFTGLSKSEEGRENHLVAELSSCYTFCINDEKKKGYTIDFDVKQYSTIIKEGLNIYIDERNIQVYKYLLANLVDFLLSTEYDGKVINYLEDYNGSLYSVDKNRFITVRGYFGDFEENPELEKILVSAITNHNLGYSSEQQINNFRDEIEDQVMVDGFDRGFERSVKQYAFIKKESDSPRKVLKPSKKN